MLFLACWSCSCSLFCIVAVIAFKQFLKGILTKTMDSSVPVEISDDDDSFSVQEDSVLVSSDEDHKDCLTSDEELPSVQMKEKKLAAIKNLFPTASKNDFKGAGESSKSKTKEVISPSSTAILEKPKDPGVNRMIEGVNVNLPVNPYGCQVALMSMLIKSIKGSKNCLLESPTGSGKTLALLCGALGWLSAEKEKFAKAKAEVYFSEHPELNQVDGAMEYVTSPMKNTVTPEKMFSKTNFGEKSIYDSPNKENGEGSNSKRSQPMDCEESDPGLVRIHKKQKLNNENDVPNVDHQILKTPEKNNKHLPEDTPEKIRNLVENLHIRTSMLVNCSVPTIYYGARTHKQLQQVIKEFGRTSYCGQLAMSVLSSREHSCIREFDKQMWGTKNDMCRGCIKKIPPRDQDPNTPRNKEETNCKYYDNRKALDKSRLPPAFDLEDLVNAGHELTSCPHYAAREMAQSADIVFCPYNYLIDPSIRASMRIDLQDHIVIIDEAHNIEDICRDSATFTFTRDSILAALKELEHVSGYRYSDSSNYVEKLIAVLKSWDYWFANQTSLIEKMPVNNNEATYMWQAEHFAKTLQNHNIGHANYHEFRLSAEMFCNKLRDEPGSLYGVTQSTGTLVGSLDIALGYLFRQDCKYMDDFKPVLVRSVAGDGSKWRNSQFKKSIEKDTLELRLICMNPAVVFESLKESRCIVLASGTLTPLISLHSELDTEFPLRISPSHVIPPDRVWIGTLLTHPDGTTLECKSKDTNMIETQDSIGQAILWVCQVTPNGVLCFVPSYALLSKLVDRWECTGVWQQLCNQKHVFQESRNAKDHSDVMEDYYKYVATDKGALLFAVYRGKVSEGMDFKDHQARAVITVGVPYPNTFDMAVKAKMDYNDRYSKERNLLTGRDWLKVQAYRALNQAVGRCVRHKNDWGAVLLIDGRFQHRAYTEHLSKWVLKFLENNHHTFESLQNSPNSLESFMQNMNIREMEDL